jgi:PAS domain S-box-containing protein
MQNSEDLLCIYKNGYISEIGPSVTKILGWTVSHMLKTPLLEFIHPEDISMTVDEIDKILEHKAHECLYFTNRVRKAGGGYVRLEWSAKRLNGDSICAIARPRFIDADTRQFVHDISNLLAIIAGNANIPERASRLDAATTRAIELVMSFRKKICQESKKFNSVIKFDFFDNIKEELEKIFGDCTIVCDADVCIDSDVEDLKVVLMNLANNSVKAKATRLSIFVTQKNDVVSICVRDNGSGMTKEELDKLGFGFSKSGGGDGVGIIRNKVHGLGGTIAWNSIVGIGTECTISLKKAPATEPELEFNIAI